MNELNKNILKAALDNLPQYEPPDAVWQGINTRLPLLELPTYDAPDVVWEAIEKQLSEAEKPVKRLFILRGRRFYKLAIAASVAVCVSLGFWFFRSQTLEHTQVEISTEVVDNQLLKKDFDDEEQSFQMVEEFCKTATPVCEQPDFKNLKTELDTLNQARESLKNAMGDYAADADLVAELTKIENERTTILRQLVEKIN